jgi:hypothetical protein
LRAYQSPIIRASLDETYIRSCIAPRSNRKDKIRWNRHLRRESNRIDRVIGHRKIKRAIAPRHDIQARSFHDSLHIAAIRRCLRYAILQTGAV